MHWGNLKNSLGEIKGNIDRAKQKDPAYSCEITLIGLPSDVPMQHIADLKIMSEKWKENWQICTDNAMALNKMLLDKETSFTANVLKSVFKNYINWGTSIPTSAPDLLTLYDPKGLFTALDLPRKTMEWWEAAENDAGILKDQVNTIQQLNSLLKFYETRRDNFTSERQAFVDIINSLKPVEEMHAEMGAYIKSVGSVKYADR